MHARFFPQAGLAWLQACPYQPTLPPTAQRFPPGDGKADRAHLDGTGHLREVGSPTMYLVGRRPWLKVTQQRAELDREPGLS